MTTRRMRAIIATLAAACAAAAVAPATSSSASVTGMPVASASRFA